MGRLTPEQLRQRHKYDFAVVQRMNGAAWEAEGYRSAADLKARRRCVTDEEAAGDVTNYLVTFRVPTLVGPGELADTTVIAVSTAVGNYPYEEPLTEVLSKVPYSPHFKASAPVCLGELGWREAQGRMLLGQLINHLARLLNWDEVMRGGGYRGWNGAAIDYHQKHFGDKPLNPDLEYPALPVDLTHGIRVLDEDLFARGTSGSGDLFAPAGRAVDAVSHLFEST